MQILAKTSIFDKYLLIIHLIKSCNRLFIHYLFHFFGFTMKNGNSVLLLQTIFK